MILVLDLDLTVPTDDWKRIERVRGAVGHCVGAVFADRDLRDALAMVTAELLENAFKYGKPDQGAVRIRVRATEASLVIRVTNGVDEGSPHARQLVERVAWARAFADPRAAYEAALCGAYTDEPDQSGLGLARILYEGGCDLDLDFSTAGEVTVSAACAVER